MSHYLDMIKSVTTRHNDKIISTSKCFCEYFNLVQFWYNRVDDRGFVATLSNHAEWTEYFAAEKLYQKCPLLRHSQHLQEGIIVLNDSQEGSDMMQILSKGKSKYNMNIWVALVIKTKNGTDQFGFCADRASISLFFNELPLIKLFAKRFRDTNQFVLSKLEDHQVNLIDLIGSSFHQTSPLVTHRHAARQTLLKKLGIACDTKLTPQEIKVIKLVLQGYSASTIAPQVFLAKRTIDHLLERVKEKLHCDSKTELIQKTRELEETGYLENQNIANKYTVTR